MIRLAGLMIFAPLLAQGAAQETTEARWQGGAIDYEPSPPLEGYFAPLGLFKRGYTVRLEDVLQASRRMTPEELQQFTAGSDPSKAPPLMPLFVYKNLGVNVFLWKGRHVENQQIVPRVWEANSGAPSRMGMIEPTRSKPSSTGPPSTSAVT